MPWRRALLILAVAAAALLGGRFAHGRDEGPPSNGQVVRVVDGDTIRVRLGGTEERVRYIGVDTPETVKPGTPVQCYGPAASDFTHHLLTGRTVRLVFGVERRDVYGRLLAYVHLGDRFVNAALVRRGLARTLTIPPNDRYAPFLRRLELAAARAGRGLWAACRS